jgi:hypothetical protein
VEKSTASISDAFSLSGQNEKEGAEIFARTRAEKVEVGSEELGPQDRKNVVTAFYQMPRFLRKLVSVRLPNGKSLHTKPLTLQSKYFSINERLCQERKRVCDIGNGYRLFRHR